MGLLKKLELELKTDWGKAQLQEDGELKIIALVAYRVKYRAYLNHKAFLKLMAI